MSIFDLVEQVNEQVEEYMTDQGAHTVRPEQLGLDERAGHSLRVAEDWIAVKSHHAGSLDYYGGFEYVDESYKCTLGDWIFYSADDERVYDHIQAYWGEKK